MTPIVYINGSFLPEPEAMISVDDGGWLHGAGLFETMRAENDRVFRLEAHMSRLMQSAESLLRPVDRSLLPSHSVFAELLQRNGLRSARLRMTVSSGSLRGGAQPKTPILNICVSATALTDYPPQFHEEGIQVVICPHRVSPTDPIAGHKTTSYLPRILGLRQAQRADCMEALWFTTQNYLAEGCISNVFVVTKEILRTPPLETPVLPGIARAVVLELAHRQGIQFREETLNINDLLDADEVFLTNTIMQVMPVIRVEKSDIAGGTVGPFAKRFFVSFRHLAQSECAASL
jgi:branched-chain amino acid aminotransferase